MIKFIRMFITIGAIVLCAGCNKNNNNNPVEDDISESASQKETSQQEDSHKNAGNYFKDANIIQDYNPNHVVDDGNIMYMENDLMYSIVRNFDDNNKYKTMIYVADLKTGVQVPLCSKVDCNHNSDRCNAYLGDNTIIPGNMWCIDGIIYLFCQRTQDVNGNKTSDYFLMRVSSDGSVREDLGSVLTVYGNQEDDRLVMSKSNVLIHRGYLYYVIEAVEDVKVINNTVEYGKTTDKLYRYNINGKSEPECIYEYTIEKEGNLLIGFQPQGEYLYVTPHYAYLDSSGETSRLGKFKYEEYKIHTDTLEKEEITSGVNYCNEILRNSISYTNMYNAAGDIVTMETDSNLEFEEQLRTMKISFYDKETEEIKHLTEKYLDEDEYFSQGEFWITDKYICLNTWKNNGEILERTYVFDLDWNLAAKLDERVKHCFGEYILWQEGSDGEYDYYIGRLEDYVSGDKKCGRICKLIDKPQGSIIDMNRYIYED